MENYISLDFYTFWNVNTANRLFPEAFVVDLTKKEISHKIKIKINIKSYNKVARRLY